VPIVQWWVPLRAVAEIRRRSAALADRPRPGSLLLWVWWTAWLAPAASQLAVAVAGASIRASATEGVAVVNCAALLTAGGAATLLLVEVTSAQESWPWLDPDAMDTQ
jgi:hypothetical protein